MNHEECVDPFTALYIHVHGLALHDLCIDYKMRI